MSVNMSISALSSARLTSPADAMTATNPMWKLKMPIRRKPWCLFGLLLALAGCDQEFRLLANDGSETRGTIVINSSPPNEIAIALKGEEFAGYWRSYVVDESEAIRKHYGAWSSTYKSYASGQSSLKLRHAHAIMRGSKGSLMECEFDYRGEKNGQGVCDLAGVKYRLLL